MQASQHARMQSLLILEYSMWSNIYRIAIVIYELCTSLMWLVEHSVLYCSLTSLSEQGYVEMLSFPVICLVFDLQLKLHYSRTAVKFKGESFLIIHVTLERWHWSKKISLPIARWRTLKILWMYKYMFSVYVNEYVN